MTTTTLAPDMQAIKAKLKNTWTSGDFGQIAKSYAPGAAEFVDRLNLKPGERVLDVACGNGNLAIPAARCGASVIGQDISLNLLEQGRERARAEGLTVRFDENDAEQLPYDDASFDTIMTMFGGMFTPQPKTLASEMTRTCRSGGRIVMANWTPNGFIGQMLKIVGKHVPPAPGIPSPLLWGDEATVRERFNGNISNLQLTRQLITFNFPFDPTGVVDAFLRYYGPTYKAFNALDEKGQAAFRHDLEQHWSAHNQAKDGTTKVDAEYLEVLANRA